jgi:hypothetical protein
MRQSVKTERAKKIRWSLWVCLAVVIASNGCSGINASRSVSPLDFLLPGLHIQNRPPAPLVPEIQESTLDAVWAAT